QTPEEVYRLHVERVTGPRSLALRDRVAEQLPEDHPVDEGRTGLEVPPPNPPPRDEQEQDDPPPVPPSDRGRATAPSLPSGGEQPRGGEEEPGGALGQGRDRRRQPEPCPSLSGSPRPECGARGRRHGEGEHAA